MLSNLQRVPIRPTGIGNTSVSDNDALPLSGQTALVTGASSGIGAASAHALAAAGAAVGVNFRSSPSRADAVVEAIRAAGGSALALQADVSNEDEIRQAFERFVAAFRRIDIPVANAGVQCDAALPDMSLDDWRVVLDTNLSGQFLCIREAIRRFLAQPPSPHSRARGKIICMSAVHQFIPWAGHVNYAASKGGVMMLMKSVAQEVAKHRIRVNGIAPGAIRTDINRKAWETAEAKRKLLELIPYGRIGEADDIARAVTWLASDDSDYVTGTTLVVDGGMGLYPGFGDNG